MTKIQWTEDVWNPIAGCSVLSPGCTNCYAMRMAWRLSRNPATPQYHGTVKLVNGKPVWTGVINRASDATLTAPLRRRKPTVWFVNSMSDLFHEDVPDEWIDRVFAVMALCPRHKFQVLTKRAARMREYMTEVRAKFASETLGSFEMVRGEMLEGWPEMTRSRSHPHGSIGMPWPLPNVWLGVSAEDQRRADERIHDLRHTPAAVRFVSYEPALGPVDFTRINNVDTVATDALRGVRVDPKTMLHVPDDEPLAPLDWVIVGGESGPGARPCNVEWIRQAVAQCRAAAVPVFVKQLGACFSDAVDGIAGAALDVAPEAAPLISRRLTDRKGGDMAEWPADLRKREMPT